MQPTRRFQLTPTTLANKFLRRDLIRNKVSFRNSALTDLVSHRLAFTQLFLAIPKLIGSLMMATPHERTQGEKEMRSNRNYQQFTLKTQKNDRLLVQEITSDSGWDKLLLEDSAFQKLPSSARG